MPSFRFPFRKRPFEARRACDRQAQVQLCGDTEAKVHEATGQCQPKHICLVPTIANR
jgi:hypothetical protein